MSRTRPTARPHCPSGSLERMHRRAHDRRGDDATANTTTRGTVTTTTDGGGTGPILGFGALDAIAGGGLAAWRLPGETEDDDA